MKAHKGWIRLFHAARYSWQGLQACFRDEAAFRQEILISLILIPMAFYWGQNSVERALLLFSWLLVPLVELLNSGLEAIVDKASPEIHPLAKKAKDIGSAAVLWALLICLIVWLLILI